MLFALPERVTHFLTSIFAIQRHVFSLVDLIFVELIYTVIKYIVCYVDVKLQRRTFFLNIEMLCQLKIYERLLIFINIPLCS